MKAIIKEIILENQELAFPTIIEREIQISLSLNLIVSLIGARRSGKTYILYHLINKIKAEGISKKNILFINFEDERLNLQQKDLDLILQAYQELYPNINLQEVYFFFDEIQNISGWEKFVRRIFDSKSKKIIITGSNAKLLSTEIATELRGRTITYTIYPYSFSEFLTSKKAPKNINTQANKSKIINFSEQFLLGGGFPELVQFDKLNKIKVLQQYFNVMIYRDIIERYKIANPEVLKFFIKKIFSSVTSPFSINKIYNDLKSMGYKVSNKYLYEYVSYCDAVFLTQNINKFNYSEIKQIKSDKKTYIIDNGLLNAIDYKISQNKGKLLENMVALELLKQEKELFYFKEQYECDFIIRENDKFLPIQVSFTLQDDDTKKRELRGLYNACKFLNRNDGIIITFNESDLLEQNNIKIKVIPFYQYFGKFNI